MNYINVKIKGIPFCQNKNRGNIDGPNVWTKTIIEQTKDLPKVIDSCIAKITFLLPKDKFPSDYPFGPDLDNLLKRFLDALNETIFSKAHGKDSCVISLTATKVKVNSDEEAGAILEIIPVKI
jgi:Holliday junction resolvase RusA-like endonuclease